MLILFVIFPNLPETWSINGKSVSILVRRRYLPFPTLGRSFIPVWNPKSPFPQIKGWGAQGTIPRYPLFHLINEKVGQILCVILVYHLMRSTLWRVFPPMKRCSLEWCLGLPVYDPVVFPPGKAGVYHMAQKLAINNSGLSTRVECWGLGTLEGYLTQT